MSNTTVIGVRVPKWVKEELKKLGIDYAREVREYLIKRVREERARRLIKEVNEFRRKVGRVEGNLAAEFVREDRNEG